MTLISAFFYAASGCAAAFIGYFWQRHHGPVAATSPVWPALELLLVYAVINAFMIYVYGAVSGAVRRDKTILSAPVLSAVFGLPFWFIIMPAHLYLIKTYSLPKTIWLAETAVICGVSFEAIRLLSGLAKKRA